LTALDLGAAGRGKGSNRPFYSAAREEEMPMGVSVALAIAEAIAGAVGGIAIGRNLNGSSLGNAVNSIIGIVGGVTAGHLLRTTLPDLAQAVVIGSTGGILSSIIGALIGGGILITICALLKDNVPGVRDNRPRR